MGNLGEELDDDGINRLIVEADADGDGKISFEDFRLTMKRLASAGRRNDGFAK